MIPIQNMKIVMFGVGGVGKTSLIHRYLFDTFDTVHNSTVEDDYRRIITYKNDMVEINILDTAGSYQFPAMRKLAIQNGHGFIITYAIDNKESFNEVRRFYEEIVSIKKQCPPIIVVGNKVDTSKREVTLKDALDTILNFGSVIDHIETSALDNFNISYLFNKMISDIDKQYNNTSHKRNNSKLARRPQSLQLPKRALISALSLPLSSRSQKKNNALLRRNTVFKSFFKLKEVQERQ